MDTTPTFFLKLRSVCDQTESTDAFWGYDYIIHLSVNRINKKAYKLHGGSEEVRSLNQGKEIKTVQSREQNYSINGTS